MIVAWTMGVTMDLNFNLLETGSLALAIVVTAFTLQVYISQLKTPYFDLIFKVLISQLNASIDKITKSLFVGWYFSLHERPNSPVLLCCYWCLLLCTKNTLK